MEIFRKSGLPIAMVTCFPIAMGPCLHQSNVYIEGKLRVLKVQKCNFLVGAKTVPTDIGLQTTRVMERRIGPTMEIFGSSGLPIPMVLSLHECNVYIKRKLRMWRAKNAIS